MFTFCTKTDIREASDVENSPQIPQNGQGVPSKWLQCSQSEAKWPQSPLKVIPGAPKTNPSTLKWSPKASPDPLKSMKKGVQDHPGTPLRKWTSPSCENPIIYHVLCTSKILIVLKSNENLIIYYVLEPPDKPVSARNGKRVEKKKVSQALFYSARLIYRTMWDFLQRICIFCTKGTYTRPEIWKTPPRDLKVSPESPRSDSNATKVSQSSLRVRSKWLQVLPKRTQVLPSGPPRPPQTP